MLNFFSPPVTKEKESVSFAALESEVKKLLDTLAASDKSEEADFYPFLAIMLRQALPEQDIIVICAELLKLAFQQKNNFNEALLKQNLFCIHLMAILLRADFGPFNKRTLKFISEHPRAHDGQARINALLTSFNKSNPFLVQLLAPLYFEFLRAPESEKTKKPAKNEIITVFINQIIRVIKLRLPYFIHADELPYSMHPEEDSQFTNYLKAELEIIAAEKEFKLAENLESAIQIGLANHVSPSAIEKLKATHLKWSEIFKQHFLPLYERIEEISSLIAYMEQHFPPASPRQRSYNALNIQIRIVYNELLSQLSNEDLGYDDAQLRDVINETNQRITDLILPEMNKPVAGQTPLHRLAKEKPVKEEEKKSIAKMMARLLKEGASPKEKTALYERRLPMAILDSLSHFPWIGDMVHAFFYNPKRDVFGISESSDVLNGALEKGSTSTDKQKSPDNLLASFKNSVLFRFSRSKAPAAPATSAVAPTASIDKKESLRAV